MRIDACLPVGWGGVPDGSRPLHPAPDATPVRPDEPGAAVGSEAKVRDAALSAKSSIVLRAGRLALASGAGGYRVRRVIDRVGAALGVGCRANVTLMTIDLTVSDGRGSFTEVAALPNAGVNTERIWRVEGFVDELERYAEGLTATEVHEMLDAIERLPGRYCAVASGVASALACAAFVFLLGGGPVEMLCAGLGAGIGQWLRRIMLGKKINQFATTMAAVAVSCLVYLAALSLYELAVPGAAALHQAGYIGAMLFVIPGFPLITAGLDIAKMELASGIERLVYSSCIIGVATLAAWCVAKLTPLSPADLVSPDLAPAVLALLRVLASFVGVYGFSVLFNSTPRMAFTAACIGAVANTGRLELIDLAGLPPEAAALVGALVAGLIASAVGPATRLPRVSLTVPSIVIMVPGLYMYTAMYYMCDFDAVGALGWGMRAAAVVVCLPIGLALARVLTDREWRYDT